MLLALLPIWSAQAQGNQPLTTTHYLVNDQGQVGSLYLDGDQTVADQLWASTKMSPGQICQANLFAQPNNYSLGTPLTIDPGEKSEICWRLTPNGGGTSHYQSTITYNPDNQLPVNFHLLLTGESEQYLLAGLYNHPSPVSDINYVPADNCDGKTDFSQAKQIDNFAPVLLDEALGNEICFRATVVVNQSRLEQFHYYYAAYNKSDQVQILATNNHPIARYQSSSQIGTGFIILMTAIVAIIGFVFLLSLAATVFVIRLRRQKPAQD